MKMHFVATMEQVVEFALEPKGWRHATRGSNLN